MGIDERKLEQTLQWLQRKQNQTTGCFKTEGFVVHSSLAKDSDAALTASLVISVSETSEKNMFPIPTEPLNKVFQILDQNLLKSELFTGNDLYTKTLTAYAFALENKTKESNELLDKLLDAANDQESGKLSWRTNPDVALGYTSQDIEIGAYNVLTLIKQNRLSEALKVIKWLATQRNSYGGFKSTQDTMIALQAFAEYSLKITEEDNDFEVNEENELLLQTQKLVLDSNQDSVKAQVNGEGCFVVQSILRYNVKKSPEETSFTLILTWLLDNFLKACASYTGGKEKTNMVVIEIELLSGFEPTPISLKELKNNKQIKKVEYDEKTSTVALYFNDMPKEEICHQFQMKEVTMVEDRKPAIAKIYDYYDQKDILSMEYS